MSGGAGDASPPRRGVVLVGFMGCGKSTIGAALARRLDVPFADSDVVIEERYGPIPEIFARQGEGAFRALEREVVLALLEEQGRGGVLALGGGAVTDAAVRAALRAAPHVVWLSAPPETLWGRVAGLPGRPLAADEAGFCRLFSERETLYRDVADVTVDAGRPIDVVVDDVLAGLTRRVKRGGHDAAPAC